MSKITDNVRELLKDDMVSHGWVLQCIEDEGQSLSALEEVLTELLSRDVEIGVVNQTSSKYLEFIAWKGTIIERVKRAREHVERLTGPDREFAYWLALRKNVDLFEVGNE